MYNHNLLRIIGKPSWLTLRGGRYYYPIFLNMWLCPDDLRSRVYVDRIISSIPAHHLHLNTPVRAVYTAPSTGLSSTRAVGLQTEHGNVYSFDHVILACHADTALKILRVGKGLTEMEERILGAFQFNSSEAVLHSDIRVNSRAYA